MNKDEPAFPSTNDVRIGEYGTSGHSGMTLRAYAAIKLKVPDSGLPWLDDMIRKARRDEDAAKAMQSIVTHPRWEEFAVEHVAAWSYDQAYAMQKAREK